MSDLKTSFLYGRKLECFLLLLLDFLFSMRQFESYLFFKMSNRFGYEILSSEY